MKKAIPEISKASFLPAKVAEMYTVPEGRLPMFVCAEFGEVDLTTVTLEFAARLAEKGYLNKIEP
jgi:hypothetical protein